jgi:hypothetical protein
MSNAAMMTAEQVVTGDLKYLAECLRDEFRQMAGMRILLTGGAGFLGHYFVESALHWNKVAGAHADPISLAVFDNFSRGMPVWLTLQTGNPALTLVRHDIRNPLPVDFGGR